MTRLAPAGLAAALVACAPPPLDTADVDEETPSIEIVFPNPALYLKGELLVCPSFRVSVAVDDFDLSQENYGGDDIDGQGHWHLYVDDVVRNGTQAAANSHPWAEVDGPLAEGDHTLLAVLVTNGHQDLPDDLQGQDTDLVEFEVAAVPTDGSACQGGL